MQITYPITYFPSNWNILTFFTTFRFASFHFILFCASWVLSCEFTLSKWKKLRGNVVFTTTAIRIYFASLTLICKLLFILRISLETKMSNLNSQTLAFLGTLFILAIKTWSFGYLLFFYCLQNNNDVSPISTYKIIIGDIWLTKICIY